MLPAQQKEEIFIIQQQVIDLKEDVRNNEIRSRSHLCERIALIAESCNEWQNDGDPNRQELLTEEQDMDLFLITQDLRDLEDNIKYCNHGTKATIFDLEKIANKLQKLQN